MQYRVSLSSVINYGIRQGLFSSAADVWYLVTAEEYAALIGGLAVPDGTASRE